MIEDEKYYCNDNREASRRENEVMKELKADMNKIKSYCSRGETLERKRKYFENNKERYKEHRDNNKEMYKEKKKKYYEKKKEHILEQQKQSYMNNKEQYKESIRLTMKRTRSR